MFGKLQQKQNRVDTLPPDDAAGWRHETGKQDGKRRFSAPHLAAHEVNTLIEGAACTQAESATGEENLLKFDPHPRSLQIVG